MSATPAVPLTLSVDGAYSVSALLQTPGKPRACLVFGHGAGAGMHHEFMASVSQELAARAIATMRYQFPYMEQRSRRPDPPAICHATVRAAVAEAARRLPSTPLLAGGKSFGGRMTSQAQAASALPAVVGLAFMSFPLHPAGKPSIERARHLEAIDVPMLFLQGTRDELAESELLRPVIEKLGSRATLYNLDGADHSWHVPAKSGRKDADVRAQALEALSTWLDQLQAASDE